MFKGHKSQPEWTNAGSKMGPFKKNLNYFIVERTLNIIQEKFIRIPGYLSYRPTITSDG